VFCSGGVLCFSKISVRLPEAESGLPQVGYSLWFVFGLKFVGCFSSSWCAFSFLPDPLKPRDVGTMEMGVSESGSFFF
jgi:hypothetical protein